MQSTTPFNPGDVVLVPFPFSDFPAVKKRPALMLAFVPAKRLPSMAIVAMITSRLDGEAFPGDCGVSDWKGAGLLFPSRIRLSKLVSLEAPVIIKTLGHISDADQLSVWREIRKIFSSWNQA